MFNLRLILLEALTLKTIFKSLNFLIKYNSGVSSAINTLSNKEGVIEGYRLLIIKLEKLFPSDCK